MALNYLLIDAAGLDFVEVAPAAEIGNGQRVFVDVSGEMIVVFNVAGEYFAIADVCSHDDGPVGEGDLSEFEITCPRHGAGFDIRTGRATSMPAVVDIPAYPVMQKDGMLLVGVPKR